MSPMSPSPGWRVFAIVWSGQLVSLVGSGLTSFVLGLWVLQRTQSVTQFALILLSGALPRIFLSPLAGALVDRWDRRWVMLLSDVGAGLSVLAVALLYFGQQLAIWQIYIATAVGAACATFQLPAYIAATTLLASRRQLGRVNGLLQLGLASQDVLAPVIAGLLVVTLQLGGVLLIDVGTFVVSVFTLLSVRFPTPPTTAEGLQARGSLRRQMLYGWTYIVARPGLLVLLVFFATTSFLNGLIASLIYPLILSLASATQLGIIISLAGTGLVASSLLMSVWNGPQRRVLGVLGSQLVFGLGIIVIGLRPSGVLVAVGALIAHAALPVSNVTNQAIWQSKVAADVQGRVFAMRQMVGRAATPIAFLLAGPLADAVFNPLLTAHGALAGSLGQVIGVGPGRGIGLIFLLMGILALLVAALGFLMPRLRSVERELPDASEAALSTVRPEEQARALQTYGKYSVLPPLTITAL
ncbi:MAG TPA: MFS transporter [Ktedonobacterales bacterium]|jgi:MFS family permease